MNLELEKIELTKLLLSTNNPFIIESIKEIFAKAKEEDFWDVLADEQQREIQKATEELKNGESVDFDSFMAKHRS